MIRNFYYALSYQETEGNGEYLVLTEYDLYNPGRSLPDHPPPENLVKTHEREASGFTAGAWSRRSPGTWCQRGRWRSRCFGGR